MTGTTLNIQATTFINEGTLEHCLEDMLRACECLPTDFQKSSCRLNAVLYHKALTGGGMSAYDRAQDKACDCEDPPPDDCDEGGGPSLQAHALVDAECWLFPYFSCHAPAPFM
jgi:hypothetical protein